MNLFDLIMLCIYSFGLGWVINDITGAPTLYIVGMCLVAGMAILVMKNKRGKK
jgi:Flp pilus assembly protein TadB